MNRTNLVIRHAAALGLDVDIGLAEKTKLLLGKTRHVVKHIPSMPLARSASLLSIIG